MFTMVDTLPHYVLMGHGMEQRTVEVFSSDLGISIFAVNELCEFRNTTKHLVAV
jgi:hypothetical protein